MAPRKTVSEQKPLRAPAKRAKAPGDSVNVEASAAKKSKKSKFSKSLKSRTVSQIPVVARRDALQKLDAVGLPAMCAHFQSGKSMLSLCKLYDVTRADVQDWINEDAERGVSLVASKLRPVKEQLDAIDIDELCTFVAEGNSLREWALRNLHLPMDVHIWLESDPVRWQKYTAARERRADKIVEELLTIADSKDRLVEDQHGCTRIDIGKVARDKLRVDTRKWIVSKFAPKAYGDRQILAGDPSAPLGAVSTQAPDLSRLSVEELQMYLELQRKVLGGGQS